MVNEQVDDTHGSGDGLDVFRRALSTPLKLKTIHHLRLFLGRRGLEWQIVHRSQSGARGCPVLRTTLDDLVDEVLKRKGQQWRNDGLKKLRLGTKKHRGVVEVVTPDIKKIVTDMQKAGERVTAIKVWSKFDAQRVARGRQGGQWVSQSSVEKILARLRRGGFIRK
jgi:hypothetical protein